MTVDKAKQLEEALAQAFDAEVDTEQVNNAGRYRFAVLSEKFTDTPQLDRQDQIWRVVEQTLERHDILDISLILAYAPGEIDQAA